MAESVRGRVRTGSIVPCTQCGKDVYRHPSTVGRKLCSIACRSAAQIAKRVKDGMARCAKCRLTKPVEEFVKGSGGRPHSYCKTCSSTWFHEMRGTPPEKRRAYMPTYRLTDEEKAKNKREANQRQHSARRAAGKTPGRVPIEALWCAQHGRCAYCDKALGRYHIDHKQPISRGGSNDLSNLHLTCGKCNMRKGAMTHEEFLVSKSRPVRVWA